jgi:hypothetical protein
MKKWILISVCVLVVGVICVDVFIPSTLTITRVEPLLCRPAAAFHFLSDEARWKRWWPQNVPPGDFHIQRLAYQTVDIGIREGQQVLGSRMSVLPANSRDSTVIYWETELHSGWSPLDRIRQYRRAAGLSTVMDGVLAHAGTFLGKMENLYGVSIREVSTVDTLLVATRVENAGLPTNADIYKQIDRLQQYISAAHIQQNGNPMANFTESEKKGTYRLMVAIPVNSRVQGKGDIVFMRLVPGKYLTTEVTGGPGTVAKALSGMEDYIRDYQRSVMAVPFQSIVTDRRQVTDSTRWVTRLFYPIF